ncbi:hypothetical protein RIF29_19867 [Crotalaria pallida]|uniref:Importin N-terminal domain-containing protein n=1 Tax=Crotalaria pallida TaxID=3830 RepID=A0AAN9I5V2_CROPI
MQSLAQLEALCERLYNSQDSVERAHAENTLKCFSVNADYISQCQYLLDNASSPYALMLASSSMLKQVTEQNLPLQLRIDIRNYLINYLATKGPELETFVLGSLIQLFCRITKFGWLDDERFGEVVKEAMDFLSQAQYHYAIGLKILNQLVSEINQPNSGLPPTRQRRIASSFRDQSLFQIFQISLTSLFQSKADVGSKLQELSVSLALSCLSFDFMGTSYDECSDEIGTVQFPLSWKPALEDPSTLQIFFDYYAMNQTFSKQALDCLLRLASSRRSVFPNDDARLKFLSHLMQGTKEILQTGIGLTDHDNYHGFCRLLGRFKVNYQLSELVSAEGYGDWIHLVAEFTLKSLHSWKWAGSSIYYLLNLWSKMVASVQYLNSDKPSRLDEYVPKFIEGFLSSRFNSLQSELSDEIGENPLDNAEILQDQLDFFPYLCRFQYESCSSYLMKTVEPIIQNYMEEANHQIPVNSYELSVTESKLAWFVHIVAAILKTRQISSVSLSRESHEILDAEISARTLQLMHISDSGLHNRRYGDVSKQRLDRAMLTFLQYLRRCYIGDQPVLSSKLYARLSELGLHDHLQLLNAIAGKIATNLKSYTKCKEVIDQTLGLFLEMASGYVTGKLLLKLDTIKHIISNQNREQFPFLENWECFRSRTTLYYIIGMLVFMEDSLLKFKSSMEQFLQVFVGLESTPDAMFQSDAVKFAFIGLMRDLRGIAMATNSRKSYGFLFDWLYPAHMPVILKASAHCADVPEVTTPLLKFVAELVLNKSQRVTFDSSSPNGILLFREVSKLIVAYGSRVVSLPNKADLYTSKYKGISICLIILSRALSGNYVNFGIFELYGDRALVDALDISVKMILSIPLADILAFRKVAAAYFTFLEILFNGQLSFILSLDKTVFVFLLRSLESGLKDLSEQISSQCASAIDNLASFYFMHVTVGESPVSSAALNVARLISDYPVLFSGILKTLFEVVILEDRGNQWSLSRAILSLILNSEEMFTNIKAQILALYRVDQHQRLSLCFDKLMADVTLSLDAKNREKFSKNLAKFQSEFCAK